MTRLLPIAGVFLALMIVSQSLLAVSAPCPSLDPAAGSHAYEMAGDPHAGHHMDGPPGGDAVSCCEGGYCSISGCLSLLALSGPVCHPLLPVTATAGRSFDGSFASLSTETPYRPPIAR
jgi:hypothetical protein